MGLLNNKYYSAFKAINKVRNNYAHKHDYKVTLEELNAFKFDWVEIQNKAFAVACGKSIGEGQVLPQCFYVGKQYISSTNKKIKKGRKPLFIIYALCWTEPEQRRQVLWSIHLSEGC
jgi:hypothetical protein